MLRTWEAGYTSRLRLSRRIYAVLYPSCRALKRSLRDASASGAYRNGRMEDVETGDFHRFGDDYLRQNAWRNTPETARRVALALGPEPIEDARHLLPPVSLPSPAPPLPPGPV